MSEPKRGFWSSLFGGDEPAPAAPPSAPPLPTAKPKGRSPGRQPMSMTEMVTKTATRSVTTAASQTRLVVRTGRRCEGLYVSDGNSWIRW